MNNIFIQDEKYIKTLRTDSIAKAAIYTEEQRKAINSLLRKGYYPKHTAIGKGLSTKKHWNLEEYKGKYGVGFKMITSSPYSHNFNHLTYFVRYY